MPTAPRLPDDQPYDGLLVQADLPPGWHLPGRFPGGRDDASGQIDAVLGYNDQVRTAADRQAQLDSDQNETVDGRWLYIEHESTGTRVLIRLQRQLYAVPEEVRITGVVYLPWRPGDPITSQLLRELPTARIEASINKRLFAMNRTSTITGGKIVLPSGRKIAERELLKRTSTSAWRFNTVASRSKTTRTPAPPSPRSTASPSLRPKAGSPKPAPAGSSPPDAAAAPDKERASSGARSRQNRSRLA
jgi:hypothetical protein